MKLRLTHSHHIYHTDDAPVLALLTPALALAPGPCCVVWERKVVWWRQGREKVPVLPFVARCPFPAGRGLRLGVS